MKTKKVMAVLALVMAGMFVSAQTYVSPEEAAKMEQAILNAERPETTANPIGFDCYHLFWEIYFSSSFCEVHPTSRAYDLSKSENHKSMQYNDGNNKTFPKYWKKKRQPRLVYDGVPINNSNPVRR